MYPPMSAPVAVAICTYNRPLLLDRLIVAVVAIAAAEFPDQRVPVVVVDDSREGSARSVVESSPHAETLRYVHTASGDISVARNAAVSTASELAPFVVCVDDDCTPQPGWLRELLTVADESGAAIVAGHHRYVVDGDAPRWLSEQPFLLEHEEYEDGSVPAVGNMSNVLIRSTWFRSSGVRFRRDLGRLGGEDMVFFADAKAQGAEIRFSARSLVLEPRDAGRMTLRYHLWRQAWLGNNEAHIALRTGTYGRSRLAARGVRRALRGIAWPVISFGRNRSPQFQWALALIASGLGLVTGAAGVEMSHRS